MQTGGTPVAVVTAAGSGIGKAAALRLVRDGLAVLAVDKDADALGRLQREYYDLPLHTHTADMTDEHAVLEVFAAADRLGALQVLVNGVGSVCSGDLRTIDLNDWRNKFELNLTSVLLCSRAALPLFARSAGDRVVINISSTLARVADPDTLAYGAFKAALEHMTRAMALDLAPAGIRVVAVAPGPVAATGGESAWEAEHYAAFNPLNRFAAPDEIADVIAFLASPHARYITGTTLPVDGGDGALGVGWGSLERLQRKMKSPAD